MRRVSVVGSSGSGKSTLAGEPAVCRTSSLTGSSTSGTGRSRDPELSVIAWSWHKHADLKRRHTAATLDPANAHLEFIRVAGGHDARRALAAAGSGQKRSEGDDDAHDR